MDEALGYLPQMESIPGWFVRLDALIFLQVDRWQRENGIYGGLLEIGVFEGRSAGLLGYMAKSGEQLEVCDLFEAPSLDSPNVKERRLYEGLRQTRFEGNFLRFHPQLPVIHRCPSTQLSGRLGPDPFRFVHIDGSHLYGAVAADLALSQRLLCDGGVVAVDDWCTSRLPGVAAATWQAIVTEGLVPFAFTPDKLYATWSSGLAPNCDDLAVGLPPHVAVQMEDHAFLQAPVVGLTDTGGGSFAHRMIQGWVPLNLQTRMWRALALARSGARRG